jgi:hypothetical protein
MRAKIKINRKNMKKLARTASSERRSLFASLFSPAGTTSLKTQAVVEASHAEQPC